MECGGDQLNENEPPPAYVVVSAAMVCQLEYITSYLEYNNASTLLLPPVEAGHQTAAGANRIISFDFVEEPVYAEPE